MTTIFGRGLFKFTIGVLLVLSGRGFDPADRFAINCGSPSDFAVGDFTYVSDDSASRYLSTARNILADANSDSTTPPRGSRLHRTARIFPGPARYTFPISRAGRHWIRFHFYPFVYRSYDMGSAAFSVFSQRTTLLSNFSVKPEDASVREYSVNVTAGDLAITFSPSPGSFAFLNALEVVSVPDDLITDGASVFHPPGPFHGLVTRALETVARVNCGGPWVSLKNDTLGRTWVPDRTFLVDADVATNASNVPAVRYPPSGATSKIAPQTVYGTCTKMNRRNSNVTWGFRVDPGFEYLIRFHFCDIVSLAMYQLFFNVYIGTSLVAPDLEVSTRVGGLATAYYMDFVTPRIDLSSLTVSIGPSPSSTYPDAFINGLEIMKISNAGDNSLTTPSVLPEFIGPRNKRVGLIAGVGVGVPLGLLTVVILFLVKRRKKQVPISVNNARGWSLINYQGRALQMSYRIPLVAIQEATNNFAESWVVGVGGFGKVYRGSFRDGTEVAVKRGNPRSRQGLAEFRTEIEMLSQFRHRHLVSLIGYCDERNEMILVYEYMEKGTLRDHLYGSDNPSLGWKERLGICIGSARGLHYLHTGYVKAIIHRDVKSANILLDGNLMAKVADFGLSKTGPDIDQSHVSTAVKGSFGYLDPEYFRRQQLTDKSDVYSFGVVLFEVLCARPVIDPSLPSERVNLAEWAMKWQRKGKLGRIIDPNLAGKVRPESLRKFGETAEKCLADLGADRPSMGDVLWNLEYALQLQEAAIDDNPDGKSTQVGTDECDNNNISDVDSGKPVVRFEKSSSSMDDFPMSSVFSQIVKSEGR